MQTANPAVEEMDTSFESVMADRYLTFWMKDQLLAIPIVQVLQIVRMQEITPVPMFPPYAKGIIDLRGMPTPVIDLRLRLEIEEMEYNDRTCIMIVSLYDMTLGFIVDGVDEVTYLPEETISDPPSLSREPTSAYISGVGHHGGKSILLIKLEKLIDPEPFMGIL